MIVHYNLVAGLLTNMFGVLILVCLLLSSHVIRERNDKASNRWMTYMIVVCLVGGISEIVFELVDGRIFPFSRAINIAAKTTNHMESILAGFLFIAFMRSLIFPEEKNWPKPLRIITIITCAGGAVMLFINLFTGCAFTVDENNLYSRGPLGQLGLIISMTTLLYTVYLLSKHNKNTNTYVKFPVLIYILPFIIGGGLQMVIPSLRLSSVAFALGITTAHLNVQRRLLYTDPMTGVFNRTYLDYFFTEAVKKKKSTIFGGLLIDINSFKQINDTHGHIVGDEAIKNTVNILKKASEPEYLIMRYGGDEFVLIKENADMEEILAQKARINSAAEAFNNDSDAVYELAFAIGVTVCDTSNGGFDMFLDQMDKSLYLDKKAYYERTGKERRR